MLLLSVILATVILIIPTMLVLAFQGEEGKEPTQVVTAEIEAEVIAPKEEASVAVYRTRKEQIEIVDFEDYIIGVVSSEMPADFEFEALKAQALTARTYIVKQMLNPGDISLPDGAMVTDTVMHQVYHSEAQLRELWGKDYERRIEKIRKAVQATRGKIITYDHNPITAAFFSTSNGYTENSEDYWQNPIPYLRSVQSPWDEASPKYSNQVKIPVAQFEQSVGVKLPSDGSVGEIVSRTDGNRIETVKINGKTFSGREIREKLDLNSSDFTWKRQGQEIVIETKGWGHGVGMSQYGANGMASAGKTYEEIIKHYYQGVEITSIDPFLAKLP